ncbi:hypothetical protein LY12_002137 [Prauserella alba]|uniref:Uncharacterized protein n=2 Tax=Prauserella alba TaxID=176898 RepID=A0ABN1VR44_9PSEU|nr:hypothetical protein [Prauserella alba]
MSDNPYSQQPPFTPPGAQGPAPQSPGMQQKPAKFVGLAWSSLILGIVGLVGSPVIIFNNITAIAAGVGLVLGIIALFGSKKVVAGIGVVLCVAAVAVTVVVQQNAVEELDRITDEFDASLEDTSTSIESAPSLPDSTSVDDVTQPETNERNYIPMQLEDKAWVGPPGDARGSSGTSFAIDSIEVDPGCHAYGMPPESGHTLLLHVRVATGSDQLAAMDAAGVVNPFSFVEIGADGVSHPADIGSCTDFEDELSSNFGVNQKYSGTIEIVVPEASGTLALDPGAMANGPSGWEWTY